MYKDQIGSKSNKVKNIVERGLIKKFAESIGDSHPIFINEEYGKQSRYGQNIAPPTFPRVFDYGDIDGLYLPNVGLIHGEQVYHYVRPLFVGEEVYCYTELVDYYEKKGGNGLLGFVILKRYGEEPEGKIIFTESQTIIISETVRKELVR
ncbi:MaoC family dehydratase N-terminal domain-containing protein [Virgibacillus sp. NKC19-16]|uniref:MaoC family dehydratase N-terminal domain-containing protein n=1 Tax=Virgibacillus salidurans TaxID=2831673 RepID=UPI001F2E9A3C|nr:MaoC family dehydratase N-terminal domain-containing protein [Virgibacillus sp. NKC19-16]UJL45516.1 MaoC family dehydratase N-terminal domain-containing protein [Virgibacillus sp. NKC19-16]